MPSVRTMYTREELLRIAALASAMDLGPEVLRKFDVIEVADPVPAPKRREPEPNLKSSVLTDNFSTSTTATNAGPNGGGNTGGKSNHNSGMNSGASNTPAYGAGGGRGGDSRRGGGVNGTRDDSNNGSNFKHSGYDRFAPPEGRFARGNRNQETFEEGIEYELRQSALQKKRVAETMEREDRKGEHLRQALEKFKLEGNDAEAAEAQKETDEIERLLAGITMIDDAPKTVARSRFFSPQGPATASVESPAVVHSPPPPPSAAKAPSFGASASSNVLATSSAPQASVLATPANSGMPGYATGPWSSMKSDLNLWSTAPSMASALKQSLQRPLSPRSTSPPAQMKPSQPASQQSQQPARPPTATQQPKGMGAAATTTSANTASAQSISGSASFGVSAPAPTHLSALQSSVQGLSNGSASADITAAMGFKTGGLSNGGRLQTPPRAPSQASPHSQLQPSRSSPATAAMSAPRSGGHTAIPTGAWSAADLELLLKKGATVLSSAAAPPSGAAAPAAAAPKTQPITAAELESMLMQRARQVSGAAGAGMNAIPPSPPHFHQPPPPQQASLLFANPVKAPPMPTSSNAAAVPLSPSQQLPAGMKMTSNGAVLPPKQQHQQQQPLPPPPPPMPPQMPTHTQSQPQLQPQQQSQQQQQPPWMAMPRPLQAPPASQPNSSGSPMHNTPPMQPLTAKMPQSAAMMPNGLQMPMQMNAQGQYFVDPAQLQRVYMTGQPMMFRRPDGTVFMQAQPMSQPQPQQVPPQPQPPFNPFGTNAQFLFQQQQQRR
ncbi:hypothetical protein CUR178_01181 [Leishmania enriettii]|uniref:4E-interacting protein n=1 Tax=Leishmania enriettii TaxID=5663 RepID=A0A836GH55_LEIEN|nr:hypothetical protein CUR178_01181 [Leishmania enriettii]